MSQYNLIDEKWIPVRFPDGSRDELGIRDTLIQSRTISAIEDSSPLVVAALHRFLLAVLYRALEGPTDINQAKEWFRNGWPDQKIYTYLDKWQDRFWLFDEKYPFGQNPFVSAKAIEPWTKLTAEFNATSNKVLFDHTNTKNPGSRKAQECARWIVSTMTFSISGGRGYYPSPSPNAILCIPLGRSLQKTLGYCLIPYLNKDVMRLDSALWERKPRPLPLNKPKRDCSGYVDLYTWQPRMILLEQLPSGEVKEMRFAAGEGFENSSNHCDPMIAYKISNTLGKIPVQFREERRTWRDFDSLLPDNENLAPLTIQNAIRISDKRADCMPGSILAIGQKYQPPSANVDFWCMERFVLPKAIASERFMRSEIRRLLDDAENTHKALSMACRSFARNLLSHGERKPAAKDITAFIEQLSANAWYWSALETHFNEILVEYTLDRDPDDIRWQWLKNVKKTFKDAWENHYAAFSRGDAWTIRALVKAEVPIRRKLKELNETIAKLEPLEEEA